MRLGLLVSSLFFFALTNGSCIYKDKTSLQFQKHPELQSIISNTIQEWLRITQACSNPHKLYISGVYGLTAGFGSEFTTYLMQSLLTAMLTERRLVYTVVTSNSSSKKRNYAKNDWEYDCATHEQWACYFSFNYCNDSFLHFTSETEKKNFIQNLQQQQESSFSPLKRSNRGSIFLQDRNDIYILHRQKKNIISQQMFKFLFSHYTTSSSNSHTNTSLSSQFISHIHYLQNLSSSSSSFDILPLTILAGSLTHYLFQYQNTTFFWFQHFYPFLQQKQQSLNNNNNLLSISSSGKISKKVSYFGLQLRLTDKYKELSLLQWQKMNSIPYLSRRIEQLIYCYNNNNNNNGLDTVNIQNIHNIYIGKNI
jgi:hypothetical protein